MFSDYVLVYALQAQITYFLAFRKVYYGRFGNKNTFRILPLFLKHLKSADNAHDVLACVFFFNFIAWWFENFIFEIHGS